MSLDHNISARQLRAAMVLKSALIEVFQKGIPSDVTLFEPKITVTEVLMSPDLKIAHCSVMNFTGSKLSPEQLIDALNSAKHIIRQLINPKIQMRFSPELRFKYDYTVDVSDKINRALNDK